MLSSLPSCALKPRAIPSTILQPPCRSLCPIYQISQDEAPCLFYLKSAAWQSSFTLGLNWIYRAWLLSSADLWDLCWGFGRLQVFCFSPVSPSSPSASDLFQAWKMKALFCLCDVVSASFYISINILESTGLFGYMYSIFRRYSSQEAFAANWVMVAITKSTTDDKESKNMTQV